MAKVAADYGHGRDTWETGGGKGVRVNGRVYEEHDFNADVGEQVRHILEGHGVEVLVTQPPHKNDVGLDYRTNLANRENVDLFVSFHANAGDPEAQGACVFAWKGYEGANRAADLVVKHLKEQRIDLHGNGRHYSQIGSWTNFHVLRETDMSAILIEHGFMTNDRDFENIFGKNSKDYRRRCAIADAKAILDFFNIEYNEDKNSFDRDEKVKSVEITKANLEVDGYWGAKTTSAIQRYFDTIVDGVISGQYKTDITTQIENVEYGRGGSLVIKALQGLLNVDQDGYFGPVSLKALQRRMGTPVDGVISRPSMVVEEMQRRLNKGKL